ncbi:type I toxin-antitoxin system Fst family toxin [Bacillus cereus]|nr:type I toxin-antitoxin system Fst family toxin [Bacillus cereus]
MTLVVAPLVVGVLLDIIKRWLDKHDKRRDNRH